MILDDLLSNGSDLLGTKVITAPTAAWMCGRPGVDPGSQSASHHSASAAGTMARIR